MVHQPVSRGFAVFADAWLSGWLAEISADLRETFGSAPRLRAIQIHIYFTLLYYWCQGCPALVSPGIDRPGSHPPGTVAMASRRSGDIVFLALLLHVKTRT